MGLKRAPRHATLERFLLNLVTQGAIQVLTSSLSSQIRFPDLISNTELRRLCVLKFAVGTSMTNP